MAKSDEISLGPLPEDDRRAYGASQKEVIRFDLPCLAILQVNDLAEKATAAALPLAVFQNVR